MCDELKRLGEGVRRKVIADLRRGHATWFNAGNEHQAAMEEDATAHWASEMANRHGWDVGGIARNTNDPPDCLADRKQPASPIVGLRGGKRKRRMNRS